MSVLKESQHLKIPLKEIEIATKNFQLCIGKGGYGMVYKGELSIDGNITTVAVKRLNEQFGQGLKEFLIEIQLLTGQKHPNLITLIGYCDEGKEKIIVYEYAENGSLDQYLRRGNAVPALTWLERLKICVDAARGLNHLHNHVGKHQSVIHRDIKSANILIDKNWVAKISDLGLSKLSLAGLNRSLVISHACGTQGYCEPEYFSTGIVRKESDVYSFGMVLFEVLCGRLCFIMGDDGFLLSAKSVKNYYEENKLDNIVDPILREQTSLVLMNRFATCAYNCLNDDRAERPPMDLVAKELEQLLKIQLSSYPLETPRKIRSDLELHMFDETLQARAKTLIDAFDLEVEDIATSFDSEEEQGINEEEVKVALNTMKGIEKNRKWVKLVENCLNANSQTRDFIGSLTKCIKRARENQLLILEAIHHLDEEHGGEEDKYGKVVDSLKKFKLAGDPCTEDFFWIFNVVYKRQITFLEKLERMESKFKMSFIKMTFVKKYKNEIIGQKALLDVLRMVSFVATKDLEEIRARVNELQIYIESLMMNADFAIKMEDAVKYVIEELKKQFSTFSKTVDDLEQMATVSTTGIERVRTMVLRRTIKSLSNH